MYHKVENAKLMAMRFISRIIIMINLWYKNQFTLTFVINENIKKMLYLLIYQQLQMTFDKRN